MSHIFFKNKGFTIIETLVAVALLMIAIAGPMVVASQALTAAVTSRNGFIAANLAQEGMEYIKNIKDTNTATALVGTTWLTGIDLANTGSLASLAAGNGTCVRPPTGGSVIECRTPDTGSPTVPSGFCNVNCRATGFGKLYIDTTGYQTTTTSATSTPFTRYFYITPITTGVAGSYDPNQAVITVVVSWNQGTDSKGSAATNQVTLQELMTNSIR